jgi:hypothetical protein
LTLLLYRKSVSTYSASRGARSTVAAESDEKTKNQENPFERAFWSSVVILFVKLLIPAALPFAVFSFWQTRGGPTDWVSSVWFIFVWGVGVTAIFAFLTRNDWLKNRNAEQILVGGAFISVAAGVIEEIIYRWLAFLAAIPLLLVSNWVFGGWLFGTGLPEWLFTHAFGPLANWVTFGALHEQLSHPYGWQVGAALLAANAAFRNGHKYQGPLGVVNSWFLGMVFFWILFEYGLLAAIAVHFLYDMFLFVVEYVDAAIERKLGWSKPAFRLR